MFNKIKGLFKRKPKQDESIKEVDQAKLKKAFKDIKTVELLAALKANANSDPRMKVIERYNTIVGGKIKKPKLFPGVVPKDAKKDKVYMATDSNITDVCAYAAQVCKCNGFPGYGFLAELTQYSEYRSPSETTSMEMVRKWVKIKSSGSDKQSSEKVEAITQALNDFGVKDLFEQAALHDGQFGNSFIYVKLNYGGDQDKHDMEPLVVKPETITKGMLDSFKIIEPIWVTPYDYNSTEPTADDFYKPNMWYVMSKKIHASRMLQFVSRPVPDLLKPVYNFGGISMTQLIIHYVEAWYRTRNSVNDMISSFSMSGIKTDLMSTTGGMDDSIDVPNLVNRATVYSMLKDNQGLLLLDKEEEFFNFNIPLSGLDALQAQSQEHMAAPTHTPLVKLNGITPTGLNANSDGEIQVYYDFISSMQSTLFSANFKIILDIIQLHLFGEIDKSITFEFNSLKESSDPEKAQTRKSDAEADALLVTTGIISVEESRKRIAGDPNTNYGGLDVDKLPPPPPNMYEVSGYGGEENYT